MIPVCLVTGFLGSGKTTLLQRLVEQRRGNRTCFLVNEFSPLDVDGKRLQLPEKQLRTVSGGSIFCKCKVSDFIRVMSMLAQSGEADELIIEASGTADPMVIGKMLKETGLGRHYELRSVICIADPGSLPKLLKTLPNTVKQLEAADTVILNKTDLYDSEAVTKAEATVREYCPSVSVSHTSFCEVELDPFSSNEKERSNDGEYATCRDPNYTEARFTSEGMFNFNEIQDCISQLNGSIYRIKGNVVTEAGAVAVDYSSAGWEIRSSDDSSVTELVFIAKGSVEKELQKLVSGLKNYQTCP